MNDLCRYRRAVSRKLECPLRKKRALLTRLDAKLALLQEDDPEPGIDKLIQAFGTPEEQTAELMKAVTDRERTAVHRGRIVRWVILAALCIHILAYLVFLIWFRSQPFKVIKTYTIYPEESNTGPWPPDGNATDTEIQVQPGGGVIVVYPEEPYTGPWPPETAP
jgi:hypothetical protein